MALALAFKVGNETYCCKCMEQLAKVSGYPHLLLATTKYKKVAAKDKCDRCHYYFSSHDAEMAAERISKLLRG